MAMKLLDHDLLVSASIDEARAIDDVATLLARLQEASQRRDPRSDNVGPRAKLVGADGDTIEIPSSLYQLIRQIVPLLKRGDAVALVPYHQELTTQEAADFLNMSRQFLVNLLERGELPFTKVGTHRRVRFHDLQAYKERRRDERRRSLAAITALSEESGEYDRADR